MGYMVWISLSCITWREAITRDPEPQSRASTDPTKLLLPSLTSDSCSFSDSRWVETQHRNEAEQNSEIKNISTAWLRATHMYFYILGRILFSECKHFHFLFPGSPDVTFLPCSQLSITLTTAATAANEWVSCAPTLLRAQCWTGGTSSVLNKDSPHKEL